MRRIQRLPPDVVKKSAAGEVVENPASIVKELVENSLDAGATNIRVELVDGGLSRITVCDDGVGISPDDLRLALEPHTSSKVHTLEDLEHISTFGFRGEALHSICVVSKLTLSSYARFSEDAVGAQIRSHFGEFSHPEPVGMSKGTTVVVEDLFANFPARRKFLGTASEELRKVRSVLLHTSLANLGVGFVLLNGSRPILNIPPTATLADRLHLLYSGVRFFSLDAQHEHFFLQGYLSLPQSSVGRPTRLLFFVNKRLIHWRSASSLVKKTYGTLLEKYQYPQGALFLTLPPDFLDVNVHPQKKEVRFINEDVVLQFIDASIKHTLEEQNLMYQYSPESSFPRDTFLVLKDSFKPWRVEGDSADLTPSDILQVDRKYLVVSFGDRILLIDQHAAHEKIIYAQILEELGDFRNVTKLKAVAETLNLSTSELDLARPDGDFFGAVATLACRSAIKAGDYLSPEERLKLVQKLLSLTLERYTCPHGRPTMIILDSPALDHLFKRI